MFKISRKGAKQGQGQTRTLKLEVKSGVMEERASTADRSNPPFIFCRNWENEKIRTRDYIGDHD